MKTIKDLFLLDPEIVYLNHGSFGACPRPVFDIYQEWQRQLERQPVEFISRRAPGLLAEARARLAAFLGVGRDDIVFFTNPTTAINMVARSLKLHPDDEILATDHEYGAMDRTWRFVCSKTGARYKQVPIPLPVAKPTDFIEKFWLGITERTKVIFISHITSPTALTLPVQEICWRARESGILTILDGAHAPGQIPLDLSQIGADIYTAACHKWLMAPKGSAFLYTRREVQDCLMPLVVSFGYESNHPGPSQYIDYHEYQGTREVAAFLSVPAAIDFMLEHNWGEIQAECQGLAQKTRQQINNLTGLAPVCPEPGHRSCDGYHWFSQMCLARLPDSIDVESLKNSLYDRFHIEVPLVSWCGTITDDSEPVSKLQKFIRVSFQGYNSAEDAEILLNALKVLLKL